MYVSNLKRHILNALVTLLNHRESFTTLANPIKRNVDNFLSDLRRAIKNDNNSQIAHTPRAAVVEEEEENNIECQRQFP